MNAARKRITETYLWQCDEIFIVCQIGRATTDAAVNAIFQLAETAKVQVGIVCTMSEVCACCIKLFSAVYEGVIFNKFRYLRRT